MQLSKIEITSKLDKLLCIVTLLALDIDTCFASNFYDEYEPSHINWTVTIIAALHAAPILAVAELTKSRIFTYLTAIVMAIIAVVIGGNRYAASDLIFVALGTFLAIKLQSNEPNSFIAKDSKSKTTAALTAAQLNEIERQAYTRGYLEEHKKHAKEMYKELRLSGRISDKELAEEEFVDAYMEEVKRIKKM